MKPPPAPNPATASEVRARQRMTIAGTVQGVGFRPFVCRLARELDLGGWVRNGLEGVTLEVEGPADTLRAFRTRLEQEPPAVARIDQVTADAMPVQGTRDFAIRESTREGSRTFQGLPDLATCADCLAEIQDPDNRRYRHPFTSCTACGPRDSIVLALPYDRATTTMRGFAMCPDCQAEYDDPADRRFHAQPNACLDCGPKLALWDASGGLQAERDAALQGAAEAVRSGRILALKALGGFQLIVDARDAAAVARLRERKQRPDKPFAVMLPDLNAVQAHCVISETEAAAVSSPAAPIVLLRRANPAIAYAVAPGLAEAGLMLPSTALHHLLLRDLGFPVVATSANLSGQPLETDEWEALKRLSGIADAFLVHDRPIARPLDDSVVRVIADRPTVLRAARGIAPVAVSLPQPVPMPTVAYGGHLKAAPAVAAAQRVILGAHVGDLDTREAQAALRARLDQLLAFHGEAPQLAVHDRHPDYASTRLAKAGSLPTQPVQHHTAHLAACLSENGLLPPVVGVVWDGSGDGGDGTVWGGEVLRLEADGTVARLAHLRPFPLPGGEAAVREPRRSALGLLYAVWGESAFDTPEIAGAFSGSERQVLAKALARGLNTPVTTSAGRLFDALAWFLGVVDGRQSYEGQAAAQLEAATVTASPPDDAPALDLLAGEEPLVLDWAPVLTWVRAERTRRRPGEIAAAIHAVLAEAVVAIALRFQLRRLALTGGCFQNRVLTEAVVARLETAGITPIRHGRVPPNDGGLALGQAALPALLTRPEQAKSKESRQCAWLSPDI